MEVLVEIPPCLSPVVTVWHCGDSPIPAHTKGKSRQIFITKHKGGALQLVHDRLGLVGVYAGSFVHEITGSLNRVQDDGRLGRELHI